MARVGLILVVVAVAFTVFTVIDCVLTERARVRGLPKAVWLVVIVLLPPIGALLWYLIGRGPVRPLRPRRQRRRYTTTG